MRRLTCLALVLCSTPALADKPDLPRLGELMVSAQPPASWGKLDWLYDAPNATDAAGKIVIHWFCKPRVQACVDDLSRLIALRDTGKVYIVAYLDGSKTEIKKLDPINGSEGVGRGTVSWGRGPSKLMKDMAVISPTSVVVDVDGKVTSVTIGGAMSDLDARDTKVNELAGKIKEYTWSANDPKTAAVNEKFQLSMTVKLAPWLKYSATPMSFALTGPKDLKCDSTRLAGDQIKLDGNTATATVTCTAPFGSYEARGEIRFSYDAPGGGTGLGTEGAGWKVVVK